MTREEAIEIVSNIYQTDKEKEALGILIPELADSEDERIRKELVNFFQSPFIKENLTDEKVAPWLAYLEKLKERKSCEDSGTEGDIMQYIEEGEKRGIKEVISFPEKYGLKQKPVLAHDENGDAILSDFEAALFSAFSDAWQTYLNGENVNVVEWAKEHAPELLRVAGKPAEQVEINKSLTEAVIAELSKYNGENYQTSPWAIDSTGLQYPLHFANLGATWQKEQKPTDISDIRDWKFIVDAVLTEHEGIGQYLDKPETERIAEKLQERFSLPQSKPVELDEESSKVVLKAVELLNSYGNCLYNGNFEKQSNVAYKVADSLKLLSTQPKPEWSENERQRLKTIAGYLRYKGYEEDAEFIESIPPQQKEEGIKGVKGHPDPAGVWKPSDRQLKAMKCFLDYHRLQRDTATTKWEEYDELQSLYDILCKIAKS